MTSQRRKVSAYIAVTVCNALAFTFLMRLIFGVTFPIFSGAFFVLLLVSGISTFIFETAFDRIWRKK